MNSQVQLNAPAQQTVGGDHVHVHGLVGRRRGDAHGQRAGGRHAPTPRPTAAARAPATTYASAVAADAPSVVLAAGGDDGTTAADASGNARPGTYVGGVGLNQAGALTGDTNRVGDARRRERHVIRNPIAGVGTTAISTDLWVKTSDTTKEAGIVSYAATSSADEFQLRDPRALRVYVKGTRVNTGVVLNDGLWHHLAVTWASAGGALRVYKDGALAFSSTSRCRPGASLTAGGALVLGQEQDTVGGGFETSQAFLGNLDEVALYPTVLDRGPGAGAPPGRHHARVRDRGAARQHASERLRGRGSRRLGVLPSPALATGVASCSPRPSGDCRAERAAAGLDAATPAVERRPVPRLAPPCVCRPCSAARRV